MAEAQPGPHEEVLLRLRPAGRSYFLLYAIVIFLLAVGLKETFTPERGRPFPLPPPLTFALAAAVLTYTLAKLRTTEYLVTDRRVVKGSLFGLTRELELTRIDELKVYQSPIHRLLGTGKLVMADSQDLTSRMSFFGVADPVRVKERIDRLIAQRRHEAEG
jgi:hypothetical protein